MQDVWRSMYVLPDYCAHTRKSQNMLEFPGPRVGWVAKLSRPHAREILPREALLPGTALRNISVWCTELRHKGTFCAGEAMPHQKRLASLLAGVARARQLQVHRNLRNYKHIVNFNEITLRMKNLKGFGDLYWEHYLSQQDYSVQTKFKYGCCTVRHTDLKSLEYLQSTS